MAAASALPVGDSWTPIPTAGWPFRRAEVDRLCEPISMRATSFRRTVEPSAWARSTMLPNCSGVDSWPRTVTVAEIDWPVMLGSSPIAPDATWAFCDWMAAVTSADDKLKPWSLAGSIQMRIACSEPNSCT
ncbi:hypothetical protein D3C85_1395420 [compost metagenome]